MSRLEKESSFCSAASTFQEGLKGPKVSTNQLLRVTLLSSEWRSLKGGLSTINRELAIELAKHPNVEVYVYLPKCSEEDKKIAGSHNVQLIEAEELPGFEPIDWLTSLPKGHLPHCLIGHGLRLGRQIQVIKRHHNCKWIQVVHTAPEELGMYKCYEEAISKGEQKHQAEVKLCELADQVVAVGPKLADAYSRYLRFSGKDQDVINLTPSPSIFTEFHSVQQAIEERSSFCVLVFGRGDNEDFKLKGYDIAVQAVSRLKDSSYQLMLVGAPTGKEDDVAAKLLEYGIRPSQLTVRRFKESREELAKLFCEVDLAIMPSRTEGFGLTALEALSAGLPILVSGNSGLGDALKKVPSGFSHVVDSENPKEWAKAIKIARQKDREVRLEDAKLLRENFAAKYSWQKQCSGLVEKMLLLTFGSFSPGQPSAVDSSLSLSCGACATSKEPVAVMFHREEEGRTKQDVCQGRKNLEGKNSSTSCKFLSSILDGLWQHQLPNFEMEQAFNIVSSQLEPHCSVCSFFSKLEDDISAHLRENLHLPLASLTADSSDVTAKMSIPRVPEICFMSDDSRPESISSWLDNKFAADTASPLLRCESCKLLVHASCYGVSDAPSDGHWQCQRCLQEDQKAIESSYCSLCRLGGGALKRTTDNRWAHLGCAVAMPEVFFVNVNLREGINTNQITSARRKLKCFYCRSSAKGKDNGACVQCCAGKCAISFHVTCLVLAGFTLEPSWPQLTETYCERHQQTRFKGKQRDFSIIHSGESVVAKHRNGRYYQGVVQNTSTEEYYVVDFEDGTYSENLPPTDIVSHDSTRGGIPWGTEVRVKWGENEDIFKARVNGRRISITYDIEFGDKSCLSMRRQDVYKANEDLPLKVQQRLGKQRDFSVIHSGESVVAKHRNGRYYHGVVQDTSTEEYYVVDFEDGTYSENLPPTYIVSHDSARDDIPWGTEVRVKWGENEDIFKARVTGRRISVAYQIEFEDKSWLSVRREDVYKANEDLPLKVQQRLSSATEQANLSYWDDIPDRSAKRRRKQNPHFL